MKWISVKDRMPERDADLPAGFESVEVLISATDIRCPVVAYYDFDDKWWCPVPGILELENENVTHWMLLPDKPEVKDDDS